MRTILKYNLLVVEILEDNLIPMGDGGVEVVELSKVRRGERAAGCGQGLTTPSRPYG